MDWFEFNLRTMRVEGILFRMVVSLWISDKISSRVVVSVKMRGAFEPLYVLWWEKVVILRAEGAAII